MREVIVKDSEKLKKYGKEFTQKIYLLLLKMK